MSSLLMEGFDDLAFGEGGRKGLATSLIMVSEQVFQSLLRIKKMDGVSAETQPKANKSVFIPITSFGTKVLYHLII